MRIEDIAELGPPLNLAEVDSFEKRIGFPLPGDYRDFLQQTNGGVPREECGFFYIQSMDWWNQIRTFYSLRNPEVVIDELEHVLNRLHEQHPEHFDRSFGKLPIAADDFGNKIYIWLAGPERGSVYFWMQDADDDEDDRLDSSFGAFFQSAQVRPMI